MRTSFVEGLNENPFQVGSITRNVNRDGSTSVIVAQPGGALVKLRTKPTTASSTDVPSTAYISPGMYPSLSHWNVTSKANLVADDKRLESRLALDYEPLIIGQMRNLNVTCEIQGGLAKSGRRGRGAFTNDFSKFFLGILDVLRPVTVTLGTIH